MTERHFQHWAKTEITKLKEKNEWIFISGGAGLDQK